ncbi:MAG: ABC transporter permease [Catonella sp.]|uniref:ABC transporter permease n=1 Tax=Catonella sp. TaxID=2382125 RepID=UPI003F9F0AAA
MKKYKTNALYAKELRQSVRSIKFPITVGLYCFIIAVIGLFTLVAISASGYPIYNAYTIKQDFIVFYSILFGLEFGLALFAVPALTGGTISGERDHGTLEMLLATALGTKRIILGKLLSAISKLMFYVFSSLPVLALIFIFGGAGIGDLGKYILLIILMSLYIGSFGILMSTVLRKTSTAMAVSYIWVMFITLGTIFIAFISNVFSATNNDSLHLIFLLNPVVTMFSLLDTQIGLPDIIGNYINFQNNTSFVMEYWFVLSLAVQMVITIINIFVAAYLLNPFRKRANQ